MAVMSMALEDSGVFVTDFVAGFDGPLPNSGAMRILGML